MKLFANENLFEPIINYLRKTGHDVLSVREGFSGISDDDVYIPSHVEKKGTSPFQLSEWGEF